MIAYLQSEGFVPVVAAAGFGTALVADTPESAVKSGDPMAAGIAFAEGEDAAATKSLENPQSSSPPDTAVGAAVSGVTEANISKVSVGGAAAVAVSVLAPIPN